MRRRVSSSASLYFLVGVVGAGAGLGAVGFEYLSHWIGSMVLHGWAGYSPPEPHGQLQLFASDGATDLVPWVLLLAPAVGGLLSCLLSRHLAPEAAGHGTDAVIDAYHNRGGAMRARVPWVKAVATAITLGTGGSGGREGPIAQIGAGIGSSLGQLLGLNARQRRILLAAGMGAGIGSIFRAPLAGALFSAEILYRDTELESDVVLPSFIASAAAYCVFCAIMGFDRLFALAGDFSFRDLGELFPYTVLAILLVPVVYLYVGVFYRSASWFERIPGPRPVVAAIGGLICGGVAVAAWQWLGDPRALTVLAAGYGVLQDALDGGLLGWPGAKLLLVVALLKIVSTSATISSGGSGGVFGPSMVIGGGIGGAVGIAFAQWGWVNNPGCFVIVGMTGFFAGAANTPISTIIMVSEMTGSYELLLPAMWVCGITYLLSSRRTIYRSQVHNRADSAAHRGEYQVALLEKMNVDEVFEPARVTTVPYDTPLAEVVRHIVGTEDDYFPVVDTEQRFVGIFSAHDVRAFTYDDSIHQLAIAGDIMTMEPIVLLPNDDLHTALDKFNQKKLDQLPVVAQDDPTRLLGFLRRRAIDRVYTQKLAELEALRRTEAAG